MAEKVTIKKACKSYKHGAIFELTNGRSWEQTSHHYAYCYQYRPNAIPEASGTRWRLKIDGMDDWIEVKKV